MTSATSNDVSAFTLIEILLASAIAAMILAALYAVFQHAIHLRESATDRIRDTRLRDRAASVIRNDLRNAFVSGGLFASIVEGNSTATDGENAELPGYLKMTTTTGKDTPDALYGDVEQVEYYVVKSATGSATDGGDLVRAVTRDLLDSNPQVVEQDIMSGVQSFQVAFYDGSNWQSSWEFNTADNSSSTSGSTSSTSSATTSGSSGNTETLPLAIRVDVQQVPPANNAALPPPIEVMVPWGTQPFTSPTPAPSASPS
jgi:prepilin-type N-terminal cleavage/methylation domain-containing protein